jgi:hypothetical protein
MRETSEAWLRELVRAHGGVAGTVHRRRGEQLELEAAVNIPEPVLRATATIPRGKGMAGLAWERDRAVTTCNLQEASSEVKPGAKAVGAGAAVAFPVHDAAGTVAAIVGVAFAEARELSADELDRLARAGATLPPAD